MNRKPLLYKQPLDLDRKQPLRFVVVPGRRTAVADKPQLPFLVLWSYSRSRHAAASFRRLALPRYRFRTGALQP